MTTRWVLALAVGCLAAAPAWADPPGVDRTVGKEPAYRSRAPEYGLLAFGPDGRDRVWLIRDGDTLYVDRNGNGDLTDDGEPVAAAKKPGWDPEESGYSFEVGEVAVGGRTHKGLSVYFVPLRQYAEGDLGKRADVTAVLAKDPKALTVRLFIDVEVPGLKGGGIGGRTNFQAGPVDPAGVFRFARTPAGAPVVRLGGPLEVNFYAERPTLRAGRGSDFILVVGTPGVGPGTFAMLGYEDTVPDGAKPVADLTLPATRTGAPPVKDRFVIKKRC